MSFTPIILTVSQLKIIERSHLKKSTALRCYFPFLLLSFHFVTPTVKISSLHCISKNLKKLQALHHPPAERHLSSVQNTDSKVNGSARVIHFELSAIVSSLRGFNQIETPSKPAKTFNSGFPRRLCQGCCTFLRRNNMMPKKAAVFRKKL